MPKIVTLKKPDGKKQYVVTIPLEKMKAKGWIEKMETGGVELDDNWNEKGELTYTEILLNK